MRFTSAIDEQEFADCVDARIELAIDKLRKEMVGAESVTLSPGGIMVNEAYLKAEVRRVVLAEREECAKITDGWGNVTSNAIGTRIRSRP